MHFTAIYRVMMYCVGTPKRGMTVETTEFWDGDRKFEYTISGRSNSDFAKDVNSYKSVKGCSTFLYVTHVSFRSKVQDCLILSVTEAEVMLFVTRVLDSMDLKMRKPMSIGGRIHHVDIEYHFLRELKENGSILVKWNSQKDNSSNLFTSNLATTSFEKHA